MFSRRTQRAIHWAVAASTLVLSRSTHGSTFSWNKSTGGTWGTTTNWTPTGLPAGSDTALFNLNATYTVLLTADQGAATLTVGSLSAAGVTFNANGHTLSIGGVHTTIHADSTDQFLSPCFENYGGTIAGGTLVIGSSAGLTGAAITTTLHNTPLDSVSFGTTIVGAFGAGTSCSD